MNDKLRLKDIIINNENNIIESISNCIDYKIIREDLETEDAVRETIEFLQMIMPMYQISADKEHTSDLLELIKIKYENYKITRRLSTD